MSDICYKCKSDTTGYVKCSGCPTKVCGNCMVDTLFDSLDSVGKLQFIQHLNTFSEDERRKRDVIDSFQRASNKVYVFCPSCGGPLPKPLDS